MFFSTAQQGNLRLLSVMAAIITSLFILTGEANAQSRSTVFRQAVAEAASSDDVVAAFYRGRNFESVWTGRGGRDSARRRALLNALGKAGDHALPAGRYDERTVRNMLRDARSNRERGLADVALTKLYLSYASDIQTGIVQNPRRIDAGIVRGIPRRDQTELLTTLVSRSPNSVFRSLVPSTPEYTRLMAEKERFERLLARGGWGPEATGRKLEPGDSGAHVVSLRNRLLAMGYLRRSNTRTYDGTIQEAVQQFQINHGLSPDGIAGEGTLRELNVSPQTRLASIIVAMERERWMNRDRGDRHVLVNITDFTARIVDNDRVTFQTRSVVGANQYDRRTPEFSDMMEHMVINPTWNVPRSIAVKEYLPMMQRDPNAASHLRLINQSGQIVSREGMDFTEYSETNFPFDMKQPPSRRNALGLVKFMFPNRHNIYLHDTPEKYLFSRQVRAFSHGCVRLNDPFDFAYALLEPQVSNPEEYFQSILRTGRESVVPLETQIPVHLIYRTAFTQARGPVNFRRDVYGRDAKIWNYLQDAGVSLRAVRG